MAQEPAESGARGAVIDLAAFDGASFDLDGVITRTAGVHAAAWKALFDAYLQARAGRGGEPFRAFDEQADYLQYVDGKPRYDGVRDFLASRGIVLPEGAPDDPPERETVCGLGNRKNALFRALVAERGVQVFDGAVAFVRRWRAAGRKAAVVSSSENTQAILEAAGLADLFDVRVDGVEAARLGLKGKPAPDTFLHAARLMGIAPARLFGVEDALAGVEAIRAAGYGLTVGIDRGRQAAALAAHGADVVVGDLGELRLHDDPAPAAAPPLACELAVMPTADPAWTLVEEGFTLTREHEVESLFAIGNGFVGTRGSLVEGSRLSAPATFVAGVFDHVEGGDVPALATVPDWTHLTVAVGGEPLSLEAVTTLEHRRILDFRQAVSFRQWRFQDAAGRRSRIQGYRLASIADRHLLVQSIVFCPQNYSGDVTIAPAVGATWVQRTATGVTLALASRTRLRELTTGATLADDAVAPQTLRVELGKVYRLDRIVAVHSSRDGSDPAERAHADAERAMAEGLDALVAAHVRGWAERWAASDVRIDGDAEAQRALRFAIYHLVSAANPDDERSSIGARALTGGAYKGHVFWDTEIYMLPFFTLTWPQAARALLMYRFHTLPAARRRAQRLGCRGALYAWESADSGEDVTPSLVLLPDGRIAPVLTGEQEHHISADVAYAAWQYWQATGDDGFLRDAGAEILIETARFWADRARRGDDGRFHIGGVIGPDEYHEDVEDNAYTNRMAQRNLQTAVRALRLLEARWPAHAAALRERLAVSDDEPEQWNAVAAGLHLGFDPATGLIEQFRGYFALEDVDLAAYEPRTAPIDVVLGQERLKRSRIIKQADVVMLLHLFWDDYPAAVREANFRYYEARCAHGSSLSPAIHALVAARLGDTALALRYFRQAAAIDLADNMGNAAGGVHAAALGGLWQALVFGFCGLRLDEAGPSLDPHLPAGWERVALRVHWRGRAHALEAASGGVAAVTSGGVHA